MSYENKDEDQKFALIVLGGIITAVVVGVLALCTLVGVGGGDSANAQKADASAMVAPAVLTTTAGAVSVAADEAKVVVENGVVKFYFATGKADLAQGADEALQDVLAGAKEGKKAVISGFHDDTGNRAQNEELSKQRAFAVRDALLALGVPESQIELRKPESTEGSGNNAEVRRVEVVLE